MPHHSAFRRVAEGTKANALNPRPCSLQGAKIVEVERSGLHWRHLRFLHLTYCMPSHGRLLCALCHPPKYGGRFGDHARLCSVRGKIPTVECGGRAASHRPTIREEEKASREPNSNPVPALFRLSAGFPSPLSSWACDLATTPGYAASREKSQSDERFAVGGNDPAKISSLNVLPVAAVCVRP